ncbi:MAG TPA: hypothetical protein VNI34_08685 [Candidatus Nitrosotalea sp.]|nr:hypothetical protein [Candidatus Nitrosotalea sp.]
MRARSGQALLEFSLVASLTLVLVLGIMDFAYLFAGRVAAFQASEVAARFAATHPTAWSSAPAPGRDTIEGNLTLTSAPARISNDDAHLNISYALAANGALVTCGRYSASAGAFVPNSGYTQATCVAPGSVIMISATYDYVFITPMLRQLLTTVTIHATASALEAG